MSHRLATDLLRRAICAAEKLPPAQGRPLLRDTLLLSSRFAIQCGARTPAQDPHRRALGALHLSRQQPAVRKYLGAIRGALDGAKAQVLHKLRAGYTPIAPPVPLTPSAPSAPLHNSASGGSGAAAQFLFDRSQFGSDFLARIHGVADGALRDAGQQLYDELPNPPDDPFAMAAPQVRQFTAERDNKLADVPDEIHGAIMESIQEGMDAGDSLAQIVQRVEDAFADAGEDRALRIARTETHSAYGFARHDAMRQQGVAKKQWLVSMSPLIRQHRVNHLEIDGEVRPIDEAYSVAGLMYPGDPAGPASETVNCGCTSIPYFDEDAASVDSDPLVNRADPGHAFRGNQYTGGIDGDGKDDQLSEKAQRAKAAHHLIDKDVQRYAEEGNEPMMAKELGGESFRDSEPVDIVISDKSGKPLHGVELKTIVDNKNAKITMKGDALARKRSWVRKNKAPMHTVVLDDSKVYNALGQGKHDYSAGLLKTGLSEHPAEALTEIDAALRAQPPKAADVRTTVESVLHALGATEKDDVAMITNGVSRT